MEYCEVCGRNIGDEHYEQYGKCQDCYNEYTSCVTCGLCVENYLGKLNCLEYFYCTDCFGDQKCKKCDELCKICSGCYECCSKICGKLKRDKIIIIGIMFKIALPDDIIRYLINYL